MKIIDAYWEKKNLDVSCIEVVINFEDNLVDIENLLKLNSEVEYIVVKVPVNRIDINEYLTENGFVFVESSINFYLNLKDAKLSPLQKRLNLEISYSEMSEIDKIQLYEEIQKGLFKTDRILLNKYFTEKQASLRYVNWIKEELLKSTQVYKILYKNVIIGFFTFKASKEGIYYPFLAGLYENYASSGLGFATLRKPIEESLKRNGLAISTFASTNNPFVIRAHIQQGFIIKEIQYVFTKTKIKIK